jgi:hypothetical protein
MRLVIDASFSPTVSGKSPCKSDLDSTYIPRAFSPPYTKTKNLHVHEAPASSEEDQIVRPKRLMIWFSWRPKDGTNSCRGVRDVGSIVATQDLFPSSRSETCGQRSSGLYHRGCIGRFQKVDCTLARIGAVC